jgi:hypothetical protein
VLASFSLQRLFYVSLIQECGVYYFDASHNSVFFPEITYFILVVEVFCASLCQHYCGFCFNNCASCFWFWHGRCNCFASCRVSSPRFLTVSFFFVATFLFLHYFSFLWQPFFFCTTFLFCCNLSFFALLFFFVATFLFLHYF